VNEKPTTSLQKAKLAAYAALNKKADHPQILDLKSLNAFVEVFVIVSGNTTIQVNAIFQEIQRVMEEHKIRIQHIEGSQGGTWILMDLGDVVVHIFRKQEREYYGLEKLWKNAHKISLPKI
jgi:ribosome-associated protein